jgi:hypothetical protein
VGMSVSSIEFQSRCIDLWRQGKDTAEIADVLTALHGHAIPEFDVDTVIAAYLDRKHQAKLPPPEFREAAE